MKYSRPGAWGLVFAGAVAFAEPAPNGPPAPSSTPAAPVVAMHEGADTITVRDVPAPAIESSIPQYEKCFRAGEDLTFAIRWSKITAGYASMTVESLSDVYGKQAYHLVSEARSSGLVNKLYKVQDRNEAWLEKDGMGTLRYEKNIREGDYRVNEIVVLDKNQRKYFRNHRREGRPDEITSGDIPANVFDVFGSLYYTRTCPLEVGKSFTVDVQDGGKVWPLVVNVIKREKVKVKAGKYDCFMVEPVLRSAGMFVAKGKKLQVWLTADERHMPVLMRCQVFIGAVSAELVKATVPPLEEPSLLATAQQKLSSLFSSETETSRHSDQ